MLKSLAISLILANAVVLHTLVAAAGTDDTLVNRAAKEDRAAILVDPISNTGAKADRLPDK